MIEISTSVLSVKKENATKTFYNLETAKTDYFHIDVMDGIFVKNNTEDLMFEYANTIKQISAIPLDVHLMVSDVKKYINQYLDLQPHTITIHYESIKDKKQIMNIIEYIKQNNIKVGLSIKPDTNIEEIYEFLPYIHLILIMTVEPGQGGQKLLPKTIQKIKDLKDYLTQQNIDTYIQADGGINIENIQDLKQAGIDIAVVGTTIINSDDFKQIIKELKK